ncbi:hypothetical protein [Deinococcus sp. LM3]|uniref:hypothetical protein n=1 Tax=Deinococcus sp. LM3 TaxID=1938608 RepID=UPI000992A3CC|nr:hypothetical protein [Deinococcus sp. LM3]OOV12454.1 hypothetical protein BXU09_16800 [Deinococcus sp. LM3]
MNRTALPVLTALLLNVQAGALCAVQAAAADLPDFTAASSWRGTLRFTVRCDRPDEAYDLRLVTGTGLLSADGPHLQLPLTDPDGHALNIRILNAASLAEQTWSGNRSFAFILTAAAQEWMRAGTYAAPLVLELQAVTQDERTSRASVIAPSPRQPEGFR